VVRALKEPDLRALWWSTILECADSIVQAAIPAVAATPTSAAIAGDATPWLQYEVARISTQVRAANNSDPSREVYTNADFEESIRFLTDWTQTRNDSVRAQIAADKAAHGVR